MELSGYLAIVRRWWWTLIVAVWVAGLAGYLVGSRIPPTYETRARLLVGPINTDIDTLRAAGQLVQTYAELVTSQPIIDSTIQELGLTASASELRTNVRATADDVTRLLTIRVQDSDPERAAAIAGSLSDELIQLAAAGTSRPEGELQVVEFPEVPRSPIAPQLSLIVLMAAAAGFVASLILVVMIEYVSDAVRGRADLEHVGAGLPFLGQVSARHSRSARTPGQLAHDGPVAVRYRLIAQKIRYRSEGGASRSTLLVGAQPSGELVDVALATAASLAGGEEPVTVVDLSGDLGESLGMAGRRGLFDWLRREIANLDDVRLAHAPGLYIVPAGHRPSDAGDPERATDALAALTATGQVIVHGGSLDSSPHGLNWARLVDSTVVVAVRERTRRENVRLAVENLRSVGARMAGLILVEPSRRRVPEPARQLPPIAEPLPAAGPTTPSAAARTRRRRSPSVDPDGDFRP